MVLERFRANQEVDVLGRTREAMRSDGETADEDVTDAELLQPLIDCACRFEHGRGHDPFE